MPNISVIIPAYNAQLYIRKCLHSILDQTYKDYEVIIVNDGSTDTTLDIIQEYTSNHSCIHVITQDNKGQAVARNKGIKASTGTFICFVDSDDYIEKSMLFDLNEKQRETNADIVWCDANVVRGKEITRLNHTILNSDSETKKYLLNNTGPWRKLIRSSIIKNNHLYFPDYRSFEDIAVTPLYGLHANRISFLNKALYNYNMHEGSIMHQIEYSKKFEAIFSSMDDLYNGVVHLYKLDLYHDELEYLFIEHLLHAASLRFYSFEQGITQIDKVVEVMKAKFPQWQNNKYLKNHDWKYKLVCRLFYKKQFNLLKLIIK